jgi:hypothetical protein
MDYILNDPINLGIIQKRTPNRHLSFKIKEKIQIPAFQTAFLPYFNYWTNNNVESYLCNKIYPFYLTAYNY